MLSIRITSYVIRMGNNNFNSALATNIEKVRKDAGLSKLSLASETHIPYSTLHRKLEGVGAFTVDELFRITEVLEISAHSLWPEVDA